VAGGRNLRHLAFKVLKCVERDEFLDIALNKYIPSTEEEAAFLTYLSKGVVRNRIKLESIVSDYSKRPLSEIDPDTLNFILIGTFQLLHMDAVPDYAAINETVNGMKREKLFRTTGFVNGVLRSISRNKPVERDFSDELQECAFRYSYSLWLLERIKDQYGWEQTKEIVRQMHAEPNLTIFVNKKKTDLEGLRRSLSARGIETERTELFDDMLIITKAGRITDTEEFIAGHFYIQDMASRLVAKIAASVCRGAVLDAAAAPGGKSMNLILDGCETYSSDISENRIDMMKRNFERMGLSMDRIFLQDAAGDFAFKKKFQTLLFDAPCSATGRIRKAPEIKYRLAEKDFIELATLQLGILRNLSHYVEPGGYLVYATCSIDRMENEEVIETFLRETADYSLFPPSRIPAENIHRFIVDDAYFKTYNHLNMMDAFFIAVLKRNS